MIGILLIASVLANGADYGSVRLKGPLAETLDRMIAGHVVGMDIDYITAPFQEKTERKRWWQTEFWGKYMHAAVPYLAYSGSEKLRVAMDAGVDRILASQEPNGYIGNYPDELRCGEGWDVWGIKYTLLGLLHYYDGTRLREKTAQERGDRALKAAERLCDYLIVELGPNGKRGQELWQTGNWSGFASSSVLEAVMWLYHRTKEPRYLDFATYIVKGMSEPASGPRLVDLALRGISVADRNGEGHIADTNGAYVLKHNRWKAYEMMSCYQGLLEYYDVTGRKDLFDAALATGRQIVADEINLAGGCACCEAWFHGAKKQHLPYVHLQETCVTTTWMRFCEKLLEETDDPSWADQLERTFYNAYLAALRRDGAEFAAYTPLSGSRWHGMHHCYMHSNCCTANGPRGFLCFMREFYRREGKSATFNFYASSLVPEFEMYTLYPRDSFVRIVSHTTGHLTLRLRIPAWSAKTSVRVNGKEQEGVRAGTYFELPRTWNLGDTVEIRFDMRVVAHRIGHAVAFTYGPTLLARDSRFDDGDLSEPLQFECDAQKAADSFVAANPSSDEFRMVFSAVLPLGSHRENPDAALPTPVRFCDYASAGNLWRRDNYYRTWFTDEYGPTE